MLKQLAFVLVCVAVLGAVLIFAEGLWLMLGLIVPVFLLGMAVELLFDFRYGNYRREWEIANDEDA